MKDSSKFGGYLFIFYSVEMWINTASERGKCIPNESRPGFPQLFTLLFPPPFTAKSAEKRKMRRRHSAFMERRRSSVVTVATVTPRGGMTSGFRVVSTSWGNNWEKNNENYLDERATISYPNCDSTKSGIVTSLSHCPRLRSRACRQMSRKAIGSF